MKTPNFILWILSVAICLSCGTKKNSDEGVFATDTVSIAKGQVLFSQHCGSCHNFSQDGIGPRLDGITKEVSPEWIAGFIHNPDSILKSNDERGKLLSAKYEIPMPAFEKLSGVDIRYIIGYINLKKTLSLTAEGQDALKDPIPDALDSSDLVANLELITQIPASSDKFPFTRITKLDVQPGKDDLFILDLRGKLYRLINGKPIVYMDMAKLREKFIAEPGLATGFGSFAFHPDFLTNGLLYTTHSEPPKEKSLPQKIDFDFADSIPATLQWVVTEWKINQPQSNTFTGAGRELFRASMIKGIHGVQEIAFNSTAKKGDADYGLLYIEVGDGGAVESGYSFLAHSQSKVWGTILRIDPQGKDSKNGHYGIPKTNPFVASTIPDAVKEIYAYGFRNPHRLSWNKDGKLMAINIGHANIEALDIILPGHDYGWPIREGTFRIDPSSNLSKVYPLPPDDQNFHITYPVAQYDHSEGKAITGGFEYTGTLSSQLVDKYFFGDIPNGRLFFVEMADLKIGHQAQIKTWQVSLGGKIKSLAEICGSNRVDLHFGKDARGEIYILTKADGKVYRIRNRGF